MIPQLELKIIGLFKLKENHFDLAADRLTDASIKNWI